MAIDGPYLFSQIDTFGLNYITSRSLCEWLSETVGFKLNDFEARLLMNRYDKKCNYTVNLGEFIEEVSPAPQEEVDNDEDLDIINGPEGERSDGGNPEKAEAEAYDEDF